MKELFDKTVQEFQLSPDDYPENKWFYAAWGGMKAVCRFKDIDIESINYIMHNAICWGHGDYDATIKSLATMIPELQKKPERSAWTYRSEPTWNDDDIERRAKEIFNRQFKAKWPDRRLNSKFAKEKWNLVHLEAQEFAWRGFKAEYDDWQKWENAKQREYEENLQDWQEQCTKIEAMQRAIKNLTARKK